MSITLVITDQGRAALISSNNTGTNRVHISEVRLGTGKYQPDVTRTALNQEFKTLNTVAGKAIADDVIHLTIKDEGNDTYRVGEFGLFTDTGILFAVASVEGADNWIAEKSMDSTLLFSVDISVDGLNVSEIEFGSVEFINPPASETVAGVVRLNSATDSTSENQAATPLAVKQAYDLANSKANNSHSHGVSDLPQGSTLGKGVVQLSTSATSTSQSEAATPSAVKAAYDLAASKANLHHSHSAGDLPNASTGARGIVQLSTSVSSTSSATAATSSAVRAAYQLAAGKASGSHSHTTSQIAAAYAGIRPGVVGSVALLNRIDEIGSISVGGRYSGSRLRYTGFYCRAKDTSNGYFAHPSHGSTVSGTWVALGAANGKPAGSNSSAWYAATLFVRVS